MNLNLGDVYDVFGHKAVIKQIKKDTTYGLIRVKLSCQGGCCTTPNGIVLECRDTDLIQFIKIGDGKETFRSIKTLKRIAAMCKKGEISDDNIKKIQRYVGSIFPQKDRVRR